MPWKNTYFYLLYLPLLESFSVKSNVKADCGRTCKCVNVSKLKIRKSKHIFFYFAKKKWRLLSHPEKNNPSFLETQLCALFCPGLFALSLSLPVSVFLSLSLLSMKFWWLSILTWRRESLRVTLNRDSYPWFLAALSIPLLSL